MTAEIARELAAFLADENQDAAMKSLAARTQVLPFLFDWSAFCGLTQDGRFVWVEYEPPHGVRAIEESLRHFMLVRAGLKYPALATLIPERTAAARECAMCAGTGTALIEKKTGVGIVCECGGVGWLPAEARE